MRTITMKFTVEVQVEHKAGLFAPNGELANIISEALNAVNPEQFEAEDGGEYNVVDWTVAEVEE